MSLCRPCSRLWLSSRACSAILARILNSSASRCQASQAVRACSRDSSHWTSFSRFWDSSSRRRCTWTETQRQRQVPAGSRRSAVIQSPCTSYIQPITVSNRPITPIPGVPPGPPTSLPVPQHPSRSPSVPPGPSASLPVPQSLFIPSVPPGPLSVPPGLPASLPVPQCPSRSRITHLQRAEAVSNERTLGDERAADGAQAGLGRTAAVVEQIVTAI